MGVNGVGVDIGSDLIWPLVVGVTASDLGVFVEQQDDCAGSAIGTDIGVGIAEPDLPGPEQQDPPTTGAGAGAGAEQHDREFAGGGAAAGTSRSMGSVVTCRPRATSSW